MCKKFMVIRHSIKELLAKSMVTRPMKCIVVTPNHWIVTQRMNMRYNMHYRNMHLQSDNCLMEPLFRLLTPPYENMSTRGYTAKLGTAHSNIAQSCPSLVGIEPIMH